MTNAYATALQLHEDTGATFIHPFEDDEVIAGQGTIGLEILDELENPGRQLWSPSAAVD